MNKKIILGVIICSMAICLGGCDWERSFSDSDTKAVATYSAKLVAKYNKKQKDGVVHIDESDEEYVASQKSKKSDDKTDNTSTSNTSSSDSSSASDNKESSVTLESALNLSNISLTYQGFDVRDRYTNSIYDMSPNKGNDFLVMRFNATNTSSNDYELNCIAINPKFTLTINGDTSATNDMTLIPEDLCTFKGIIRAGQTKELVIIFQFKEDELSNIESISLKCNANGSNHDIIL